MIHLLEPTTELSSDCSDGLLRSRFGLECPHVHASVDMVRGYFEPGSRRWGCAYCLPVNGKIGTLISGLSTSLVVIDSVLPSTGGE